MTVYIYIYILGHSQQLCFFDTVLFKSGGQHAAQIIFALEDPPHALT